MHLIHTQGHIPKKTLSGRRLTPRMCNNVGDANCHERDHHNRGRESNQKESSCGPSRGEADSDFHGLAVSNRGVFRLPGKTRSINQKEGATVAGEVWCLSVKPPKRTEALRKGMNNEEIPKRRREFRGKSKEPEKDRQF